MNHLQVLAGSTWSETSDNLASSPHFLSVNCISLFLEVFSVGLFRSKFKGSLGFTSIANTLVELFKDGLICILEDGCPVKKRVKMRQR